MGIYLALIITCLVFDLFTRNNKININIYKFLLFVVYSLLGYVSAIRYDVGRDYQHYVDIYQWINSPWINRTYEEPGFRSLVKLCGYLGYSYQSIFVISSLLLAISCYIFTINYVNIENWFLFAFLFICGGSYFSSMNLVRQYMAMSFILFALVLLKYKKYILTILLIILAVMFHKTAIFMSLPIMIAYFVKSIKKNYLLIGTFVIVFAISMVGLDKSVAFVMRVIPFWKGYTTSHFLLERNYTALLKVIFPVLLFIYSYYIDNILERKNNYFYRLFFLGALFYSGLSFLGAGNVAIWRIVELFAPFFYVYICNSSIFRISEKYILYILIISYFLLLTIVTIFQMNGNGVMPYQSIFNIK